jgi:60 kDa SS-A/Ro ribonucleoprotein
VYALDKWQRLLRFLVLGTDAGTYYVKERELTRDNATVVEACLAEDAARTVRTIVEVSETGRAPKNEPAILALALAAANAKWSERALAYAALPRVCRIPTHLFHFLAYLKPLRGWSRGLRNAIGAWFSRWPVDRLAYELGKYQSRDGWSNRDVLRLSHAQLPQEYQATLRWACGLSLDSRTVARRTSSGKVVTQYGPAGTLPSVIEAIEEAKTADEARLCKLITESGLTREMLPTSALNSRAVWEALLARMPMTAMIRNLGKMSAVGLLAPMSASSKLVAESLGNNQERLRAARIHPMAILNALRVYSAGRGERGRLTWEPVREVVDALDAAFYLAFGNVEPTGKRLLLALDVSGSMSSRIAGTGLSCREAAAALALVTANVEPHCMIVGFTVGVSALAISPRQRLDDVVRYTRELPFGGTDCALPARYATERQLDVDAFIIVTDSETWAGEIHPLQALRRYRKARVRDARQVVVGMTATDFTIADPTDPLSLDVVGFDLATPQAISDFVVGRA